MAAPKTKARAKKKPQYKSFRVAKKIKPPVQKNLSPVPKLLKETAQHMWQYKKLFFGIIAIFIFLNLVFVKGLSSTVDITDLRTQLNETLGFNGFELNAALFGAAIGSGAAASSPDAGIYQSIIFVLIFLALVWAFRQTGTSPKKPPKIRQAFYESTSSLIPFILVMCVVALQMLPLLAGLTMYSIVQSNGLAVTGLEEFLWLVLTLLLALLSVYMISSSYFAMMIATLPEKRPIEALRNARKVVAFRRWLLVRKFLAMIFIVSLTFAVVLYLTVAVIPWFAEWMVLLLSSYIFALIIGSGYKLYRELL